MLKRTAYGLTLGSAIQGIDPRQRGGSYRHLQSKSELRRTLGRRYGFDSSYERKQPATFGCNQVIKGWTEALTQMPVGSKWEIYIPQELGYGSREAGKIPPFSALIFTVELLEIEK